MTDTMINVYPRATFKLVLYCAFVTTVNLAVPVSCCSHWKNPSRGSEWCSFALAVVTVVVVAAIGFLDNFDFICRTQKNIRLIGAFCLVLQWQFNEFLMSQNNSSLFISKIACQKNVYSFEVATRKCNGSIIYKVCTRKLEKRGNNVDNIATGALAHSSGKSFICCCRIPFETE